MPGSSPLAHDSAFWRRLAELGAKNGPEWLLRYGPPVFGAMGAALLPGKRGAVVQNLHLIRGERNRLADAADVARTFGSYAGCMGEVLSAGSKDAGTPDAVLVG